MAISRNMPVAGLCISEFLGTALLVFFGVGCVAAAVIAGASLNLEGISITWGLGVSMAIYLTAGVSGAHLNPAVTIALWLFGDFDAHKVVPYIVSQFAGAFAGACLVYILYSGLIPGYEHAHAIVRGTPDSLALAGAFSTYANPALSFWQAFLVETVDAVVLMALIMALTDDGNGLPRGPLAPLLIGLLVTTIGASVGPLTGFALNPARDFAPKLMAFFLGWGPIAFTGGREIPYVLVPLFAPIVGACIGAASYKALISRHLVQAPMGVDAIGNLSLSDAGTGSPRPSTP